MLSMLSAVTTKNKRNKRHRTAATPSKWSYNEKEGRFILRFKDRATGKDYILINRGFYIETSKDTKLAIMNNGEEFLLNNSKQVPCKI